MDFVCAHTRECFVGNLWARLVPEWRLSINKQFDKITLTTNYSIAIYGNRFAWFFFLIHRAVCCVWVETTTTNRIRIVCKNNLCIHNNNNKQNKLRLPNGLAHCGCCEPACRIIKFSEWKEQKTGERKKTQETNVCVCNHHVAPWSSVQIGSVRFIAAHHASFNRRQNTPKQ